MFIFIILAIVIIFCGFAVHKLKWYFLISGYNMMSKEQQANVDVENLGKLMAKYSYFLAALFILLGALTYFELEKWMLPIILLIVLSTVWLIIRSQKFYKKVNSSESQAGVGNKNKMAIIISVLIVIGVLILIIFSSQGTKFEVNEQSFTITGMYGDEFEWQQIEQLTLVDTLPEIALRTNGSSVGSIKKGHFKLENGEKVLLFVDSSISSYIVFEANGKKYYINKDTEEETQKLYEQMQAKQ